MNSFIIKRKSLLYFGVFIALLIAPFLSTYIPIMSSVDEMLAVFGIILIVYNYIVKKKCGDRAILCLLLLIELIGMVSTYISKLSPSFIVTMYDMVIFAKPFVIFLMFLGLPNTIKSEILAMLSVLAKIIFWFTFVYFAIFSITEQRIFSDVLPILGNVAQVSWLRVVCLNIIAITNKRNITKRYIILFYISLFITGIDGFASALFASLTLFLYLYRSNKKRKLKIWQIILLALVAFVFAYGDLQSYIFNQYAPRAVLIRYGFVTANHYFPLGSGFASYGSEMAKRYYSKLYYQYGFNNVWSMSPENNIPGSSVGTLNDCYFGMVIGQYGWVGLCCYIGILFLMYQAISKGNNESYSKAMLMTTLVTIVSSIMVSNNTSSHFGLCMYAILGLCLLRKSSDKREYRVEIVNNNTSI